MTEDRSPSSALEACLNRAYPSSQKGGTLIAEDVWDLATHERRLQAPNTYRPSGCLRCGVCVHIHDLRPRALLGDPAMATEVIRFRCADRAQCGAAWQILPAFLARRLWRSWPVVERAIESPPPPTVPARTRRRWKARLATSARQLVAILTTAAEETWSTIATSVGLDGSRLELVRCYRAQTCPKPGACFGELSGLIHRLSPGVRLM